MNSEKVIYYIGIGENKGSGRTVVCAEGQGDDTMSFREVGNNCDIEEALDRCIANIKGIINNRPVEFHIKSPSCKIRSSPYDDKVSGSMNWALSIENPLH